MKRRKASLEGTLRPFSMEDRRTFVTRFSNHAEMRELFPTMEERAGLAHAAFDAKWEEALVRVTKLDGTQFFID